MKFYRNNHKMSWWSLYIYRLWICKEHFDKMTYAIQWLMSSFFRFSLFAFLGSTNLVGPTNTGEWVGGRFHLVFLFCLLVFHLFLNSILSFFLVFFPYLLVFVIFAFHHLFVNFLVENIPNCFLRFSFVYLYCFLTYYLYHSRCFHTSVKQFVVSLVNPSLSGIYFNFIPSLQSEKISCV